MKLIYQKITLLCCATFFLGTCVLSAQEDTQKMKALSDSISGLYIKYFDIAKNTQEIQGKLVSSLSSLEDKYKFVENLSQSNNEQLKQIQKEGSISNRNFYERNRESTVRAASFMEAVNNALNALEFSVSSLDYSNSIFELNNPTNTDLGFSLDKVILKIVDDKIIKGKFAKKAGGKLRSIISGILNNPIVNNPITKAIISTVPAVNSISSVFNVVNSIAVNEEEIDISSINLFTKEMQRYTAHYEALAKASRDLDFNLNALKMKSESVRKLATHFVVENIQDIYTREGSPNLEGIDMNTMIRRHYNYISVMEYIQGVERKNNNNYDFLSKRFIFPMIARSKVSFIGEEVEKLYNEYLTTLNSYHKNIIVILNNATSLSEDSTKVSKKIFDLDERYKQLITAYEKSVALEDLKARKDNIPRF